MELGVRVAYPERGEYDWYEAVRSFPRVEIAFRGENALSLVNFDKVIFPWHHIPNPTKVLSVHMCHINARDRDRFRDRLIVTAGFARECEARYIVAHPENARLDDVRSFIGHCIRTYMQPEGQMLCWETFLSKRRFLNTIESIADAGLYACYDTSHMRRDTEGILSDLSQYRDTIKVVHLSNWDDDEQHLPLRMGFLDMKKILRTLSRFDGPVILEYLREYHDMYGEDLGWASDFIA